MRLTDLLGGLALALVYGTLFCLALAYEPERGCTTDTDCGCIDDCLDPLVEDEIDDPINQQGRN